MSYFNNDCTNDAKPQSIVHQIGRLGSKITKPIARRHKRVRRERRQRGSSVTKSQTICTLSKTDGSSSQMVSESFRETLSLDRSVESVPISDDDSSRADYHTAASSDDFSFTSDFLEEGDFSEEEEDSLFDTVDQNQFLNECFLTNGQSDVTFLIHFYNEETSISTAIEEFLSLRVLETNSKCGCRRINSKSAPLFTAKLQIDPEQPTVVAIKNGKVLTKVSDVTSPQCAEVDRWLTRTRLLQRGKTSNENTFANLSTNM